MSGIRIRDNSMLDTAMRQMDTHNSSHLKSIEKLSSARRINHAGDDAAGLMISERLKSRSEGMKRAKQNIQDGISAIQIAEGGLSSMHDMMQRMRGLAIQAANDTLTTSDRTNIQEEIDALTSEIDRQSSGITFAGRKMLGPVPNTPDPADIVFLVDSSGSMAGEINNVINGLNSLSQGLEDAGITARFALIDVNNSRDDGINLDQDFTDESGISTALSSLLPVTGGVVRNWDAIAAALPGGSDSPSWDPNPEALKFVIQLTDTTANEGGAATNEAAQLLNLQNNDATYFGFINPANTAQYDDLANQTGGQLFNVATADYSSILQQISSVIQATAVGYHMEAPWQIQVGPDEGQFITLDIPQDARTSTLGIDALDVTTQSGAADAISALDTAIDRISGYRANLGAQELRLEHAMKFNGIAEERSRDAGGKITDTDYADEIAQSTKSQVLTQSAGSSLQSTFNLLSSPLSLFR